MEIYTITAVGNILAKNINTTHTVILIVDKGSNEDTLCPTVTPYSLDITDVLQCIPRTFTIHLDHEYHLM